MLGSISSMLCRSFFVENFGFGCLKVWKVWLLTLTILLGDGHISCNSDSLLFLLRLDWPDSSRISGITWSGMESSSSSSSCSCSSWFWLSLMFFIVPIKSFCEFSCEMSWDYFLAIPIKGEPSGKYSESKFPEVLFKIPIDFWEFKWYGNFVLNCLSKLKNFCLYSWTSALSLKIILKLFSPWRLFKLLTRAYMLALVGLA